MREIDRLIAMLFPQENGGEKLVDLKFFPGERPVTESRLCQEVHKALVQVRSGMAQGTKSFKEEATQVELETFLNA